MAIPLYRAKPFVEQILENIEAITYPNVEFLLADQHCQDDAVAELRERIDPGVNVRVFATRDELPWFENYNFVLRHARGRYLRLLSQDDRIAPGVLGKAVAALETDPAAVVAYGPVEAVDVKGNVLARDSWVRGSEATLRRPWGRLRSLFVYAGSRYRGATQGLIRSSVFADDGLVLPETHGHTGLSFRVWFFALSLRGSFRLVPGYLNQRGVHPESFTSKHLGYSLRDRIAMLSSYYRTALQLWRDTTGNGFERSVLAPALLAGATLLIPLLRLIERRRVGRARLLEVRTAGAAPAGESTD